MGISLAGRSLFRCHEKYVNIHVIKKGVYRILGAFNSTVLTIHVLVIYMICFPTFHPFLYLSGTIHAQVAARRGVDIHQMGGSTSGFRGSGQRAHM